MTLASRGPGFERLRPAGFVFRIDAVGLGSQGGLGTAEAEESIAGSPSTGAFLFVIEVVLTMTYAHVTCLRVLSMYQEALAGSGNTGQRVSSFQAGVLLWQAVRRGLRNWQKNTIANMCNFTKVPSISKSQLDMRRMADVVSFLLYASYSPCPT